MRTAAEDREVTDLLRDYDRVVARLGDLGINLAILRPWSNAADPHHPTRST